MQCKQQWISVKMLKQNTVTYVRSKNVKLKFRKFSTLEKYEIKMQQKISVLQYVVIIYAQVPEN